MKNINRFAIRFVNDYHVREYSSKAFAAAVEKMGYAVIETKDDDKTLQLLYSMSEHCEGDKQHCFLYDNGVVKCVVLRENLEEQDKCRLLMQQIVNIMSREGLCGIKTGKDVFTTEEFGIALVEILSDNGFCGWMKRHIFESLSVLLLLVLVVVMTIFTFSLKNSLDKEITNPFENLDSISVTFDTDTQDYQQVATVFNEEEIINIDEALEEKTLPEQNFDTTIYYVTKSGTKYHLESCSYISDISNCTTLKYEELGEYQPCKRCIK